ncbi:hypothetical protein ABID29_001575 [Streptococcus rupicaprae]|uniref:DUF2812 domain-containing protein n=1 Tax=Streptococcus rupicaprae TaxID=759619 RepID=A0ABV2FIR3_9STRE
MKKWKLFTNLKKEEDWINRMQSKGYRLVGVPIPQLYYHFEPCVAEQITTVRIDFRDQLSKEQYQDYLMLFEDSGWERISGSPSSGSHYFRQLAHGHEDVLFSDEESQLAFYQRYRKSALATAMIFLCYSFIHFTSISDLATPFQDPKSLFLTPGLWQLDGTDFLFSFLFELPFALLRAGVLFYLTLATTLFYLYIAYQAKPKSSF